MTLPQHAFEGPAVAMLDICDMPLGLRALDALVKEAPVQVLGAGTVQPGRFLLLFRGQVEPVEMAFARAKDVAAPSLVDAILLPRCEERILPAALQARLRWPVPGDTAGLVQTASPPTLLAAVDAALKGAHVDLVELRVADELGGKSLATLWGEISDVQEALSLALEAIARGNANGCSTTIIPRADDEVVQAIRGGTRFFKECRG